MIHFHTYQREGERQREVLLALASTARVWLASASDIACHDLRYGWEGIAWGSACRE